MDLEEGKTTHSSVLAWRIPWTTVHGVAELDTTVTFTSSKEQASFNFMAVVTICSDFGAQENKVCHCFHCFPSICHEVMGLDAMILIFWMLSFKLAFSLFSFTFLKRLFSCSLFSAIMVVIIYMSEIIDISPCNLDSSLCFIQPSILQGVLCIAVQLAGWQYTTSMSSFPYLEPVHCSMSGSIASWPTYRFLRRQVRWSNISISLRIFHSSLWSTQSVDFV